MRVCRTCEGSCVVIRGFHGESIAPKLGEAGTDDCPSCDGTGLDLSAADRFEEADAEQWA